MAPMSSIPFNNLLVSKVIDSDFAEQCKILAERVRERREYAMQLRADSKDDDDDANGEDDDEEERTRMDDADDDEEAVIIDFDGGDDSAVKYRNFTNRFR